MLLGSMSSLTQTDGNGGLILKLNDGACRLPDLFITDKNDTFHKDGQTYSSFRIMAHAIQRDAYGNLSLPDNIIPAISAKLIVSTWQNELVYLWFICVNFMSVCLFDNLLCIKMTSPVW